MAPCARGHGASIGGSPTIGKPPACGRSAHRRPPPGHRASVPDGGLGRPGRDHRPVAAAPPTLRPGPPRFDRQGVSKPGPRMDGAGGVARGGERGAGGRARSCTQGGRRSRTPRRFRGDRGRACTILHPGRPTIAHTPGPNQPDAGQRQPAAPVCGASLSGAVRRPAPRSAALPASIPVPHLVRPAWIVASEVPTLVRDGPSFLSGRRHRRAQRASCSGRPPVRAAPYASRPRPRGRRPSARIGRRPPRPPSAARTGRLERPPIRTRPRRRPTHSRPTDARRTSA